MLKKAGFTIVEALILLIISSLIILASFPILTKKKINEGKNSNIVQCIEMEGASDLTSKACTAAINGGLYNSSNYIDSLMSYVDSTTFTISLAGLKILKNICDIGGNIACDRIIDRCASSDNITSNCESTNTLKDYLMLLSTDSNLSKDYIKSVLTLYYKTGMTNIKTEVDKWCCDSNNVNVACDIKGVTSCAPNLNCTLDVPDGTILSDNTIKIANWHSLSGIACLSGADCYALCAQPADMPGQTSAGWYYWNNGTTSYNPTGQTNNNDGLANTRKLAGLINNTDYPYNAAIACYNLTPPSTNAYGHGDWYLPSKGELARMWANSTILGLNKSTASSGTAPNSKSIYLGNYWSSTENSANTNQASYQRSGGVANIAKINPYAVRCIRRYPSPTTPPDPECLFTPSTTTIGSLKVSNCNNISPNLVAYNETLVGAGCWNGDPTRVNCSSGDSPYPGCKRPVCNHAGAVDACTRLNRGIDYGAKNWRLPTKGELALFYANNSSLKLCDDYEGYPSPNCNDYPGCTGSSNSICNTNFVWSSSPFGGSYNVYNLVGDEWLNYNNHNPSQADSVRCVRDL